MTAPEQHPCDPFTGDGEMRALGRATDWAATPLGPVEYWPATLRTTVRTCLESPFPINLWCGPELVLVYNDAYRHVLGSKHPGALGRRGSEVWAEIWDEIAPLFAQIRAGGPSVYADNAPFVVERAGEPGGERRSEEPNAWFTFALSAVRDGEGDIVAFLNIVSETTGRLLAERVMEAARAEDEHARAEAEKANRAKSEFLATMSHEIRTPLNAIIGYTDLLELGIAGPVTEGQKSQLERVRTSSEHLLQLIEDILDLAKVEAGRMDVEPARVLAVDTIAAAVALVSPQAEKSGIRIEDPCADKTVTAYVGDEDRVRQILANLLSNAVKFTAPGGEIRVTCGTSHAPGVDVDTSEEEPLTYIRVTDTGIGIAPEEMETIFQPFTQIERGHTRTRGGTGLGLTISRHLARLMGGDLMVESQPGAGSTFTLWLPSEAALGPPLEAAILEQTREDGPRHLAAVGEVLLAQIPAVLEQFRERLRRDARIPMAAELTEADLEDHATPFLADIAQALVVLESSQVAPERLLQDGSEIQRVVAELHGKQRAQLGWTAEAHGREWEILREVIGAAVRTALPGSDVEGALGLLGRFLERAELISQRSLRHANTAGTARE
ncbi:hypothetical protein BH23GEM3_BH23GEM3_12040 [soil metagenome]